MKRSEINKSIEIAKKVFGALNIKLPPFAYWKPEDWKNKGDEANGIRKAMLGWDVTDFGKNQFEKLGRTLFTLRNGYRMKNNSFTQVYAEKFILDPPNQSPPLHFHKSKMEDIINRGGGNILIRLYQATPEGKCSEGKVAAQIDGVIQELSAGTIVRLTPGQSINIPPYLIHQFWGEEGTGIEVDGIRYSVSGEVSSVSDDWNDNSFLDSVERFPRIDEDVPRNHYLCNEYPPSINS